MMLVLRPWLLEWQKQDNSTYFKNTGKALRKIILSNIFQTSQQHCCTTAAGMLQVSRNVVPTSQQSLFSSCVSLYLEYKQIVLRRRGFVCMLCVKQHTLHLMISLLTFIEDLNAATKYAQNRVKQDRIFHLKVASASPLMSGDARTMETTYNYMRIIQTKMYRIQSSLKRQLMILLRGWKSQVEENTSYNSLIIYQKFTYNNISNQK